MRSRPLDRERRIVPAHTASRVGDVATTHLVENLAIIGERLKAVREASRDVEGLSILRAQLDAMPTAIGGRVWTQVNRHVEDGATHAAHQLGLTVGFGLI